MTAFGNISGLSAVTGERLEYWLPGAVMDSLGFKGAMAVCIKNADAALATAKYTVHKQANRGERAARAVLFDYNDPSMAKRYNRRANIAKNKVVALADVVKQMTEEVERLRARGVSGPIPVCLYRSSGKKAGEARWQRRSVAMHERFHAAMRRLEAKHLVEPYGLWVYLDKLMAEMPDGPDARVFATVEGWSSRAESMTEEILARVEEIRQSCFRSQADCQDITDEFHLREQRLSGRFRRTNGPPGSGPVIFDHTMQKLTEFITKKYGGALGFAGEALRRKQRAEKEWEQEKSR